MAIGAHRAAPGLPGAVAKRQPNVNTTLKRCVVTGARRTPDSRAAHAAAVTLNVAWLLSLARGFRVVEGRELRLDAGIRAAQVDLIQALLAACADGTPLAELRARFIDPVGREADAHPEATGLLGDTVRLVEQHLARRA